MILFRRSCLRSRALFWVIATVLISALAGTGCIKPPDFAEIPKIEFTGLSKDTIHQGIFQEDSVFVFFRFEDGDGDIGRMDDDTTNNVFFIDTRTDLLDNTFGIPFIPAQGSSNGIEGEVQILLFSTCCLYDDGADPCTPRTDHFDEVSYEIYIKDRAGNESNRIVTPPITLICN